MEQNVKITITVNGESAVRSLDEMRGRAKELADELERAQKRGDKFTVARLQKELKGLDATIKKTEGDAAQVDAVLRDMAEKEQSRGFGWLKRGKNGKILSVPDWFKRENAEVGSAYSGMNFEQLKDIHDALLDMRDVVEKLGDGEVMELKLPNGKLIEIDSIKELERQLAGITKLVKDWKHVQNEVIEHDTKKPVPGSDKFYEENRWKEQEDTKNYAQWASGEVNYAQYLERQSEIYKDYLRKKAVNAKATEIEIQQFTKEITTLDEKSRLKTEKEWKKDELKRARDAVKREHGEKMAELEEFYTAGKISHTTYEREIAQEEIEYLQKMIPLYQDNAQYRYYLERMLQGKLKSQQEQRVKQTHAYEEQLSKEFFEKRGKQSKDEIRVEYAERKKALDMIHLRMLAAAEGDKKAIKDIEKQFKKASRRMEIDMKRALGEHVTLTWQEAIEEFFDWLHSEQGQKIQAWANNVVSSMTSIFGSMSEIIQSECEITIARTEKKYDHMISSVEGNTYKVKRLEEEREREIVQAKKKANRKTFGLQVLSAIASTAQNAITAYGDGLAIGGLAGLIMAPIAASMATAAGLIQIAVIKKQQQASESQGYSEGGYTPKGPKDKVVGVVHAGEWVASQKLLANPQTAAMVATLDAAQRGVIPPAVVVESLGGRVERRVESGERRVERGDVAEQARVEREERRVEREERRTERDELKAVLTRLQERLDEPFVTVNTVTGDSGIKKAQENYEKLMKNKSPRSRYKGRGTS